MKTATLYVRVSTDEQAQSGFSLRAQEEILRRYCEVKSIHVEQVIIEDHSAKSFERPAFKQYLAELRRRKHSPSLLLFTKWDRFSRNAGDAYGMISTLRKLAIEPQAVEQQLDLETPENKLMLAFYLAAPEVENDRRGMNTAAGMRRARLEGRFMGKAPIGYRNKAHENGSRYIAIYEPEAKIMRWVFETIAGGQYFTEQVFQEAQRRGITACKQNFWAAVKNPVYCGKIYVPAFKDQEARYVQGQHEPLISEEQFYEVQDVLAGKGRKQRVKVKVDDMLPLRGYLLCPSCGRNLTGSASTGRNGKHYYYHCVGSCGQRFKAQEVNDSFEQELTKYTPHPAAVVLYKQVVLDVYNAQGKQATNDKRSVLSQIEEQNRKLTKARELLLTDVLDASDYKTIKGECEATIERLERQLTANRQQQESIDAILEKACQRLGNLDKLYRNGTTEERRQLIGSIFPEKLTYDVSGYRTARLNEAVKLMYSIGAAFSVSGNEKAGISAGFSNEAPPVGLEPTTP